MSRHYQFESILSLTGANADYRTQIKPSEEGAVASSLYNLLAAKAGRATVSGGVEKINILQKQQKIFGQTEAKHLLLPDQMIKQFKLS